jgi:hypothetical protein
MVESRAPLEQGPSSRCLLSQVLGTAPELWLKLQMATDPWMAERKLGARGVGA